MISLIDKFLVSWGLMPGERIPPVCYVCSRHLTKIPSSTKYITDQFVCDRCYKLLSQVYDMGFEDGLNKNRHNDAKVYDMGFEDGQRLLLALREHEQKDPKSSDK